MKADRVLHVAPTPFFSDRGCHIRIRGIVRALNDQGLENLVCTYPIGRDVECVATRRCANIPGYKKTEAGPSAYKYIADILLVFTVTRAIRQFRPDLLHCHLHEGVLIGWISRILALQWKIPVVFDMQGSLVGELEAHGYFQKKPLRRKLFRKVESMLVAMANTVVCSSQASVDSLRKSFALKDDSLFLVGDGADVEYNGSKNEGLIDKTELAIYSGGLFAAKGLNELQQLLLESKNRALPVKFRIIGFPTETLAEFVRREGLESTVAIIGQVNFDELGGHLNAATLAIEPKPEGSGEASGKLINYMAAGLPVICFDTPNNRQMLDGGGFFADPAQENALADTLQLALRSRDKRHQFATSNVERVRQHFSWSSAASKLLSIYTAM